MKKFLFAAVAFLLFALTADAAAPARTRVEINTGRRFPVATALGRGINRVVGFVPRTIVTAFTPRARNQVVVKTDTAKVRVNRQQIVVNTPRAQRVVVNTPRVVTQQIVLRNRHVDQVRIQQFAAYPAVQQVRVYPVVVGQLGTEAYKAQEVVDPQPTEKVILREVATPQVVTEKVILRETAGHCGAVSQFRARVRTGY
jgi:hypothetical protein